MVDRRQVSFLALDGDEKILFIAGGGGAQLDLVKAAGFGDLRGRGHFLRELKVPGDKHWLGAAALTPDGRRLVASVSEAFRAACELFVFDVASGRLVAWCVSA